MRALLLATRLAGLILAPLVASADSACEPIAGIAAALERAVPSLESFQLPNGLRVHLIPREGESTVSVRVAYDVGARDEEPGRGGVAHLFEHVMFKGSERIPDGGHFRLVRDVGGRVNAVTDYDTTQYWNTVPTAALDRVLFAEADRMRSLRIDQAALDNQRTAIQEEGLGLENLPYVQAATDFGLDLWAGTPYGHSPIGTPAELAAVAPAEATAFHSTYYSPSNAVLVIVGGFAPADARAAIEDDFSGVPAGPERPVRPPWTLDRTPRATVASDPLAPFPVYAIVWSTVGLSTPESLAISVLDDLLMGHADARLTRAVAQHLTLDAYSLSIAFRDVGLLNYVFVPHTFVGAAEIREAVRQEVRGLQETGPSPEEFCRSLRREQRERLASLATHEGVAAAIAQGALFENDPLAFQSELRALAALDVAAVRSAAERYLIDTFHTLEIRPTGLMRWLKPILEVMPDSVGASLEKSLL